MDKVYASREWLKVAEEAHDWLDQAWLDHAWLDQVVSAVLWGTG